MSKHALLSASASHRWLTCTPAPLLEASVNEEKSTFAEEGTAAHALAEYKIKKYLKMKCKKPKSEFYDDEMEEYTNVYVDYVIELITKVKQAYKDPLILIEQRLDFSNYVPEGFGTGDLVIVADTAIYIIDLKYGKGVEVTAEKNPQMMLYALGALNLFEALYNIETINMTIVQPRLESISTYEISLQELINWADIELRPKAELAIKGEGEFVSGEHCRFCRVRKTCRSRAESLLDLARYEFKMPPLLEDFEIEEVLHLSDQLSKWSSEVFAYATEKSINEGKKWSGFKLVEGRSNRKYSNESSVIEVVTSAGYEEKDIYKKALLGITDMEKLLGKKKFNDILGSFIEKPKGKTTLVYECDKRKEINLLDTAKAEFKEEL